MISTFLKWCVCSAYSGDTHSFLSLVVSFVEHTFSPRSLNQSQIVLGTSIFFYNPKVCAGRGVVSNQIQGS